MIRRLFIMLSLGFCGIAHGGPETKVASLSPRYPTGEMEITWATPLTGGCTTSNLALTNATAANHQPLIAALLAALSMSATVEVTFGGGCTAANTNWIQTIRVIAL